MMGVRKSRETKLFYYGIELEKRVPKDHLLRRVKEAVDFGFVRKRVADSYGYNGHESEDPIVILKLMFLLFLEDVKSERELLRTLAMRLDWLWFLDLDLDSEIPHHSVLSKARKRWGLGVFEELFVGVVKQCVEAGLVEGSKIHVDGSLVEADASRDTVERESYRRVYEEVESRLTRVTVRKRRRWVSRTDPEAVVVRKGKADVSRPRYKHHRAVDDERGVITAVTTTAADRAEPAEVVALIEGHEQTTGLRVRTVVGDCQYGTNETYRQCVRRGIRPHLGDVKQAQWPGSGGRFGLEDFTYEEAKDRYRCPAGHYLKRQHNRQVEASGYVDYQMRGKRCPSCQLRPRCTRSKHRRRLKVPLELELVEKGRAQALSRQGRRDRRRRKHLMEGSFADATHRHHFKRARWRGLQRQRVQDLLIATCQNVRILCRQGLFPFAEACAGRVDWGRQSLHTLQQWCCELTGLLWTENILCPKLSPLE